MSICVSCNAMYSLAVRPLVMPCGHSQCELCVERDRRRVEHIKCPHCQQQFQNNMNLPINLAVMELLNSPTVEYSQRGFWEYLMQRCIQQPELSGIQQLSQEFQQVQQSEAPRCVLCAKNERYSFDGLQSLFCSYNCYNKWVKFT